MAKKKKSKEDADFSESKSNELERIVKKRAEIENKIKELKEERKELMEQETKLKIIINTIGGNE